MAQLGRALGSGPRGRKFKSCHPDHFQPDELLIRNDYRIEIINVAKVLAYLRYFAVTLSAVVLKPYLERVLFG